MMSSSRCESSTSGCLIRQIDCGRPKTGTASLRRRNPSCEFSQVCRCPPVDLGDRVGVVLKGGRPAAVAEPRRGVLQVETCREQLAGGVMPQRLDVELHPAALARPLTLCEAQSGFHGAMCVGSLEKRYASAASSGPTVAGADATASRCSRMNATLASSSATHLSWWVLVSFCPGGSWCPCGPSGHPSPGS
jgi:hypothetical protein